MRGRRAPLRLVIFDCDGVLVDSEPISNRVVAAELSTRGWTMTAAEARRSFLGMTLPDMRPLIEARTGALPAGWEAAMQARITAALAAEVEPIPGALAALAGVDALRLPWRVASNSSHPEMAAKFARLGLAARLAGRVHSFHDVPRGKPAPDLFLAAAAAEGAAPAECVVVEDSVPGVRAAVAAGMDCLGFAPQGGGEALRAAGAATFRGMDELPGLLALALRRAA